MDINNLLEMAVQRGASDLHLKSGGPPVFRINGELFPDKDTGTLSGSEIEAYYEQITTEAHRAEFSAQSELDISYRTGVSRFRVNVYLQRGGLNLAFRVIRTEMPDIGAFGLPVICRELVRKQHGLVLVTGPTGSGKSTTLAAMIDFLNRTGKRMIFTVEDPIEFDHSDINCIIAQRELGSDTLSYAAALKHVLRQDPDVIMVGELRDLETMAAALTAAETGHLVFSTLHTPGAAQTIERFVDVFPPHQQDKVRVQLASTLEAVLYQKLIPRRDGAGRVAAVEVMIANAAVRNLIREGKAYQLNSAIQTGRALGMQTLDYALANLHERGLITSEEALHNSNDPDELRGLLKLT
jgi:twitching motility protein PilT